MKKNKISQLTINAVFSIIVAIVGITIFFLFLFTKTPLGSQAYCKTLLLIRGSDISGATLDQNMLSCAKQDYSQPELSYITKITQNFNGPGETKEYLINGLYKKSMGFTDPRDSLLSQIILNLSSANIISNDDYKTSMESYLLPDGKMSMPIKIRTAVDYFTNFSFSLTGSNKTKDMNVYFIYDPTKSMYASMNATCNLAEAIISNKELSDRINVTIFFSYNKSDAFDSYPSCKGLKFKIIRYGDLHSVFKGFSDWKKFGFSSPSDNCNIVNKYDYYPEAWCVSSIALYQIVIKQQDEKAKAHKSITKTVIIPVSDTDPTGGGNGFAVIKDETTSVYYQAPDLPMSPSPFTGSENQCIGELKPLIKKNNMQFDFLYGTFDITEGLNIGFDNTNDCKNNTYETVTDSCQPVLEKPPDGHQNYCQKIHDWVNDLLGVSKGTSYQITTDNQDTKMIKGIISSLVTHYPKNVTVFLEDNDHRKFVLWHNKSTLNTTVFVDLNLSKRKALVKYIKQCNADNKGFCDLNLSVNTSRDGVIYLQSLNINGLTYIRNMSINLTSKDKNFVLKKNVSIFENQINLALLKNKIPCSSYPCNYSLLFYGENNYSRFLVDSFAAKSYYYPLYETLASTILKCWKDNGNGMFSKSSICSSIPISLNYAFAENLSNQSFVSYIKKINGCNLLQDKDLGCGTLNMFDLNVSTNRSMNLLVWYDGDAHKVVIS